LQGTEFNVVRRGKLSSEEDVSYNIDVVHESCDFGEWQDHGFPCIDAIAYFRLHKKVMLEHVLSERVHQHYMYENEMMLLRKNVVPVCMEWVCLDGTTLPPKESTKRSTGRPKKVRIGKQSRWAYEPEKSKIVSSKCHENGHNVRTMPCQGRIERPRCRLEKSRELDLM
jgi:hypothetical protein